MGMRGVQSKREGGVHTKWCGCMAHVCMHVWQGQRTATSGCGCAAPLITAAARGSLAGYECEGYHVCAVHNGQPVLLGALRLCTSLLAQASGAPQGHGGDISGIVTPPTHHRHRQRRRPRSRRCDDDDRDDGDDKCDGGSGGGKSAGGGGSSSGSADTRLTWSAVLVPGHQYSASSRPPRQRHLKWSATLSTSVQICTKTLL
jgi:hypothetical protein